MKLVYPTKKINSVSEARHELARLKEIEPDYIHSIKISNGGLKIESNDLKSYLFNIDKENENFFRRLFSFK